MLRHKYTKKRLKNSRKKRTRKQRGGGSNSSKPSNTSPQSEQEKTQSPPEDALSPEEIRNLAQFKAFEIGEKCESVNHVNDDGSIDCPKTRSLARKKTIKFHEDKNPGCKEYANDMISQYNKTCYGDDTNTNRKWDKNDNTWRNDKFTEFYQDPTTSDGEHKELPSSCKRPSKKMVCKYCEAEDVTDPKCKCCVGTYMAKEAIAKEKLQNQQPSETKSEKTPHSNTCFAPQLDPNSSVEYWVVKDQNGFTGDSQWEKPPVEQQCEYLKPKTWDASETVGNCRKMVLHPGREYWINPAVGSMSSEPIDGVEKQIVQKKTVYYYNSNGETTFVPNDGTCGETKEETKAETKAKEEDFISLFFTSHFNKMQELDSGVEIKVIPWLSR